MFILKYLSNDEDAERLIEEILKRFFQTAPRHLALNPPKGRRKRENDLKRASHWAVQGLGNESSVEDVDD